MSEYRGLELDVLRWGEARRIIPNGTLRGQARKTVEEAGELLEAAASLDALKKAGVASGPDWDHWRAAYIDAAGDVWVTLVMGAALADVDLVSQCFAAAYDAIKDRRGTLTADGVFVKEKP